MRYYTLENVQAILEISVLKRSSVWLWYIKHICWKYQCKFIFISKTIDYSALGYQHRMSSGCMWMGNKIISSSYCTSYIFLNNQISPHDTPSRMNRPYREECIVLGLTLREMPLLISKILALIVRKYS